MKFVKYPRTPHLAGSRLQPGDTDDGQIAVESLTGGTLVFEEKLDGANCALSFNDAGRLILQSRGHVLAGGAREAQFNLLKAWAQTHEAAFRAVLGSRYLMFGEWCFAKHTVFYDRLPHFFMEFDIFDRQDEVYLSTPRRHALLKPLPVVSVPVVHETAPVRGLRPAALIGPSLYKSPQWRATLREAALAEGLDPERIAAETEGSDLAEGLYLKHEQEGQVIGRYKYVRADFHQAILTSGSHWHDRPILPNRLAGGVDLFAGERS